MLKRELESKWIDQKLGGFSSALAKLKELSSQIDTSAHPGDQLVLKAHGTDDGLMKFNFSDRIAFKDAVRKTIPFVLDRNCIISCYNNVWGVTEFPRLIDFYVEFIGSGVPKKSVTGECIFAISAFSIRIERGIDKEPSANP